MDRPRPLPQSRAEKLFELKTQKVADFSIGLDDLPVRPGQRHGDGGLIEHALEELGVFSQGLLQTLLYSLSNNPSVARHCRAANQTVRDESFLAPSPSRGYYFRNSQDVNSQLTWPRIPRNCKYRPIRRAFRQSTSTAESDAGPAENSFLWRNSVLCETMWRNR
jgi:hypothetical protein